MNQILVISPHPDDESIGCGGTLLRHIARGDAVDVIFLTSGEAGGHGRSTDETRTLREAEARTAAAMLGLRSIEFWREPDGAVTVSDALVDRLRNVLAERAPRVVYVTHPGEMHPDHRAAASLVANACAALSQDHPDVLMYEVWTPMQEMDHIEDISEVIDAKLDAVRAYKTQCDVMRFDDAIAGLNRYRGEMHSWPGGPYAEVFQMMRTTR